MKKQVADYVKQAGGTTAYSGNTRTMYINKPVFGSQELFETAMSNLHYAFPNMGFKVQMNP